ncbi:alpha/beta fold hydrolase [Microcoleus sp. OTE_8_concoct_300]|uniref:alpha/beta fold hydrolase n=1 Tax=Microcoleus sp. OTE_8_concoct_300 TaxID=2964710 RepID=UPI00403F48AC
MVRDRHNLEQINLLSICQGGTFSLCYSSLYSEKVKNLITMVTPVDFHIIDIHPAVERRGFPNLTI